MLLSVDNINVYYGAIHAIKGISFQVDEGEIVTLIGANGAGKTTTLDTVAGLLLAELDDIPKPGDVAEIGGLRFTVQALEGHRITRVRIENPNLAGTGDSPIGPVPV